MEKDRLFWPDFIRAVAIAGVVMIHTTSPLINRYGEISPADWWTALLIGTLARVTVLLFFLLTGALYLGRTLETGPFLRRRAEKILLPFFFWSLVYDYRHLWPFRPEALWQSLLRILQENTSGHLWFFYTLIGLYLFLPLLNAFVQSADARLQRYALGLWFTATALFPLLDRLTEVYPGFDLRMVTGYSGYLLLGYWLTHLGTGPRLRRRAAALYAAGSLVTVLTVWRMSAAAGQVAAWGLGYLTPQVILMTGAAFFLLRTFAIRHEARLKSRLGRPVSALSRASFGIYLVHFIFIRLLGRVGISPLSLGPAWAAIPLFWGLVLGLSWLFVTLLQKTPLLRALTPS